MAVVVAVASAASPSVAAAILSVASWHWLFLINVPIGALAIGGLMVFLKESAKVPNMRFDMFGFLALSIALGAFHRTQVRPVDSALVGERFLA